MEFILMGPNYILQFLLILYRIACALLRHDFAFYRIYTQRIHIPIWHDVMNSALPNSADERT